MERGGRDGVTVEGLYGDKGRSVDRKMEGELLKIHPLPWSNLRRTLEGRGDDILRVTKVIPGLNSKFDDHGCRQGVSLRTQLRIETTTKRLSSERILLPISLSKQWW